MDTTVGLGLRFVILIRRAKFKLKKESKNKTQMSKYTKALNAEKPGEVYDSLEKLISKVEDDYDEIDKKYKNIEDDDKEKKGEK